MLPDITGHDYGCGVTQRRGTAAHCTLHPAITFRARSSSRRQKSGRRSAERMLHTVYTLRVLRPQPELLIFLSLVKRLWKRMSSVLADVATTTQSWHTCARRLAGDKKPHTVEIQHYCIHTEKCFNDLLSECSWWFNQSYPHLMFTVIIPYIFMSTCAHSKLSCCSVEL